MTGKAGGADTVPILLRHEGEPEGRARARAHLRPTVGAAGTLRVVLAKEAPDLALTDLCDELHELAGRVVAGDMRRPEAVLLVQAETLNALFNDLTRIAYDSLSYHSGEAERMFRLAFRAQGQARATLETLALMKNPPVVFAKNIQANIATNGGQQQVNNGVACARPQEIHDFGRTELLEKTHGEPRLDTRTTGSTGTENPVLATVGVLAGPRSKRGKARAARNAHRGDKRGELRILMRKVREILREQRDTLATYRS